MTAAITRQSSLRIYIALLLCAILSFAGITVIYPVLPTLYGHFPDAPYIGSVVIIYWLGSVVAAAVCGRVGDLLGYRRMLLIVLALCSIGAIVSALAPNLAALIFGCAMQAITAAILPLSMGLVRENFPGEEIPAAVGLLGAAGMVAAGLVYVSSGLVIDNYSWQGAFAFKIVLAAVAWLFCGHLDSAFQAIMAVSWGTLMLRHDTKAVLMAGLFLCSFGLAFAQTAVCNLLMETTPAERTGEAVGMMYVVFSCFFAVGAQALFAVLGRSSISNGATSFPDDAGFAYAFGFVAITAIIGFRIALALPKRPRVGMKLSMAK